MRSSASEREHERLSVATKLETDGAIMVIWGRGSPHASPTCESADNSSASLLFAPSSPTLCSAAIRLDWSACQGFRRGQENAACEA